MKDRIVDDLIVKVIQRIKPEQFEFTVIADGIPFDIYWFEHNFKVGQTALAKINDKAVVGMFKEGRMTAEECKKHLEEHVDVPEGEKQ